MSNTHTFTIPKEVSRVTETLEKAGFEAYLVGGCVRDLVLENTPKDWDITTNAKPEDIQNLFENTFYENEYGTVGIVNDETEDATLKVIEITPYRLEAAYTDARRPDSVTFGATLEEDLQRRDFTINAMAYNVSKGQLVDVYNGQNDLQKRVIRAVGKPMERFGEDALRILRAIRLAAELNFAIDNETAAAIKNSAAKLSHISKERIRDEFTRIILSKEPMMGFALAQQLGVLTHTLPDLERGIGIDQNQAHKYEVFEHNIRALQHAADRHWSLDVRLAALLHDVSKPETRRWSDEKKDWTFHGHDVVGSRVTRRILTDLKFSKKTTDKVVKLVRWHLFFSDPEKITLSAVRRMVRNVGIENVWDLMDVRACDRIGTGRPKEHPYRLRKYQSMIEEVLRDPIAVNMLNIGGERIMEVVDEKPGPRIGLILHALLEEVLDDPKRNSAEYLEKKAQELALLPNEKLLELGKKGREKQGEVEEAELKKIREKYWVK